MAVVVSDPGGVQWNVRRKWWPFLGARWRIIVERDHADASTELVRGWRRSTARINDLALEIAQGRHQYGRFVL